MPILSGQSLLLPPTAGLELAHAEPIIVPNPAPAANLVYLISGNYYEVLVSVQVTLLTSAVAGNRTVDLVYGDPSGRTIAFIPPAGTHPPSQQLDYQWLLGYSGSLGGPGVNFLGPCAPIVMLPGYTLTLLNNNAQVGDQYLNGVIYTQRYPTGPRFAETPQTLAATPVAF